MPIQICRAAVNTMFNDDNIVFSYTTKMAVEDGVLFPVSESLTKPQGIKYPVYFNDSVWNNYVDPAYMTQEQTEKENTIRQILEGFLPAARRCSSNVCRFNFSLDGPTARIVSPRNEVLNPDQSMTVTLKAIVTAEDIDRPNPAVFFMLPWED